MDRRTFLSATAAATAATLAEPPAIAETSARRAQAAPAVAGGARELRLSLAWAADVPVLGSAAAEIARRLTEALDGRYRLVTEVAGETHSIDFGKEAAPLAFVPGDALNLIEPAMAYFTGLPASFGLGAVELQGWLAAGGGQLLWDQLAARHGVKPLLAGHTGAPSLWATRPLTTERDLAGGVLALGRSGAGPAKLLGIETAQLAADAVRDGLAEWRLVAAEWGNPLAGLALGLDRVASHYYPAGLNPGGQALVLCVSRAVWEAMRAQDRAIVEAIAAQSWSLSLAESVAHGRLVEELLQTRPGLVTGRLGKAVVSSWEAAASRHVAALAVMSPEAARINDSYAAWRAALGPKGGPVDAFQA